MGLSGLYLKLTTCVSLCLNITEVAFDLVRLDETRAAVTKHQIVLDEEDVRKYPILWYNRADMLYNAFKKACAFPLPIALY